MKTRKIPMRKCVACQEMKTKKELLRIVRTPDSDIIVDPTGKKSGRGAYICYNIQCLDLSKKKKSLERALEVKIHDDVYEKVKMELINDDQK